MATRSINQQFDRNNVNQMSFGSQGRLDSRAGAQTPGAGAYKSRSDEKHALQTLNNRLAEYIERVRQLENENEVLEVKVRELSNIDTSHYERQVGQLQSKLDDLLRQLHEATQMRDRLKVDLNRAMQENQEYKQQIAWLEEQLKTAEATRQQAEGAVRDLQHRLHDSEAGRKKAEDENLKLKAEMDKMKKDLGRVQQDCHVHVGNLTEQETMIKQLQEQLNFERGLNKQLSGDFDHYKMERQTEILHHTHQLQSEYGEHMKDELAKLRQDFDATLNRNRQQLIDLYEKKLNHAADEGIRKDKALEEAHVELSQLRNRVDKLEAERARYNDDVAGLQRHITDLKEQLRVITDDYQKHLANRDLEIANLRDQQETILQDYQNLMDVKLKLDVEIEAYSTMLTGEEARLRIFSNNQRHSQHNLPSDPSHHRGGHSQHQSPRPSHSVDYRVSQKTVSRHQQGTSNLNYTESDV